MRQNEIRIPVQYWSEVPHYMNLPRDFRMAEHMMEDTLYVGKTRYIITDEEYHGNTMTNNDDTYSFPATLIYSRADGYRARP